MEETKKQIVYSYLDGLAKQGINIEEEMRRINKEAPEIVNVQPVTFRYYMNTYVSDKIRGEERKRGNVNIELYVGQKVIIEKRVKTHQISKTYGIIESITDKVIAINIGKYDKYVVSFNVAELIDPDKLTLRAECDGEYKLISLRGCNITDAFSFKNYIKA